MNVRVPPESARPDKPDRMQRRRGHPTWLRVSRFTYRNIRRLLAMRGSGIEPGPGEIIEERIATRERIATILLSIASGGTMMLTYFGVSVPMSEIGSGFLQKGQAAAFAVTIGVFSWLGWYFLFGLVPLLHGKRLLAAITGGAVYVSVLAAIDAPFNMIALGGGTAVQMSLVDTAAHYEAKPGPIFERITAIRRLLPAIRTQAARFKKLEEQELTTGVYSGKPNPGKVSGAFHQIANLLGTLADELEANLGKAEAMHGQVAPVIATMKAQAYAQSAIRARIEAVSTAADRADELLAKMAQFDASVSIKATLKILENIFPAPTQAASAFERTQNAEVAAIAQMARPVAESLQDALGTLAPSTQDSAARVRPSDPMTAIKTYWKPLLPQWLAAIFVDIAPLSCLSF